MIARAQDWLSKQLDTQLEFEEHDQFYEMRSTTQLQLPQKPYMSLPIVLNFQQLISVLVLAHGFKL
jgi:hypothetical protein